MGADGNGTVPGGPSVLFCGDREVSASIMSLIRSDGVSVVGLGLNAPPFASYGDDIAAAAGTDPASTFYGRSFCSEVALRRFRDAEPDLGLCCGFSSILTKEALAVPRWGWVNVHRSYLPYNRGLDPLQWAVIDGTPAGVSLHVMTEEVDAGDVLVQEELAVHPTDDGASLAARADELALRLFERAWPRLRQGDLSGTPQDDDLASYHSRADCNNLRRLEPGATMSVRRLLDILRCYSADGMSGAYYDLGPVRYSAYTQVRRAGSASQAPQNPYRSNRDSSTDAMTNRKEKTQ